MSKVRAGHLDFLDGIRGLSAFYVVLTHAYNSLFYAGIGSQGGWPHRIMAILKPLAFGRYAVDMFIVLSGFCLIRSKWAVDLGAFSYSLYLIHYPIIELAAVVFRYFTTSPNVLIAATFGLCVPAITGAAYVFHLAFERPFMPGHPRNVREAAVAAAASPAP